MSKLEDVKKGFFNRNTPKPMTKLEKDMAKMEKDEAKAKHWEEKWQKELKKGENEDSGWFKGLRKRLSK